MITSMVLSATTLQASSDKRVLRMILLKSAEEIQSDHKYGYLKQEKLA